MDENEMNSYNIQRKTSLLRVFDEDQIPNIDARFSKESILVNIDCQIQKGVLVKIINEIENLCISITNFNSSPINTTSSAISIVAQKEPNFNMTQHDFMERLRSIFVSL
ncbi:unnamed protein product [Amaranthus hypochondriacus]